MEKFDASLYFHVCMIASEWRQKHTGSTAVVPEKFRTGQALIAKSYDVRLRTMGLSASAASFIKIGDAFAREDCTWGKIAILADELVGRLIDESKDKMFFGLIPKESAMYTEPQYGWSVAVERFPEILEDIEEAAKCLALSRYPAAVFHSVQIVEHGLIELGTFLKVKDSHSGWTAVSSALQKVIDKKHQDRARFEKKNFPFLEQMQGLVQGLKNAWRNKISHAHGRLTLISKEFSPEVAEEIFLATRAFMRRLAEELPPPKPKKTGKKK